MAYHRITLYDIHDVAFLKLKGIEIGLVLQGTRVLFEAPDTEEVKKLLQAFNENPPVPILNFIRTLKRLRAQMLDLRDSRA
ncbi:MAG: hypothetical protein C0392_01055 [Syntrophus sp. (in: bacteria)]|nr:hypothetical protein [Syntrophus sp. (in: bacteria)]